MTFAEVVPMLLQGQSIRRPGMAFYGAVWAVINLKYDVLGFDDESYALTRNDLKATDWEVIE